MTDSLDTIVIGAGVVGLAIARSLARSGREVVVLEKNRAIGEETSSRNSEVIHAGLYYPAGSLKALLCVAGRDRLYRYCQVKGIEHRRCGKVIVAVHEAQVPKLAAIEAAARANGVDDIERLGRAEIARLEPDVVAAAGLLSPATGIIDSHALMLALRGDLEAAGGSVAVLSGVAAGARESGSIRLSCRVEGETTELRAHNVINAAGLWAPQLAAAFTGFDGLPIPVPRYAKGNYFVCTGNSPFRHLVYPLPEEGGLGIHATLDLAGRVRFGPDVQWLPAQTSPGALDYAVDVERAVAFYSAVRTYWPALADGQLAPAYSGIRPKITGPGAAAADFAIHAAGGAGARIVHLFGIESPGLTASLAIGDYVRDLITRAD